MKDAMLLKALLKRHGQEVTVAIGDLQTDCFAFVTPLRYKNKMYLDADVTDFGIMDNSRTLYIGPPTPDFSSNWSNTVITAGDRKYTVTRADMIHLGETPAYIWAVLANVNKER